MYDLIGDIHGHATELKALLTQMDYQEDNDTWRHPNGRKVIFLGDFVGRGPEQVETVEIAREMVKSDRALALMDNREFNAVPGQRQTPKRRTPKNLACSFAGIQKKL